LTFNGPLKSDHIEQRSTSGRINQQVEVATLGVITMQRRSKNTNIVHATAEHNCHDGVAVLA